MCEQIWNYAVPYLLGFVVALLGGQCVIHYTSGPLWKKVGLPNNLRYGAEQSRILGLTECVLYIGALLINKPELLAVWLGLKTVIKWRHWESDIAVPSEKPDGEPKWILGRMGYNLFLLSNALVLLSAAIGWKLIEAASGREWSLVIAILMGTLIASIALIVLARLSRDYPPLDDSHPSLQKNQAKQTSMR